MRKPNTAALAPGSIIGIVGGGQLGRMMAIAAAEMGYRTHIFCPEKECPASSVADFTTTADYLDIDALQKFADAVQVVTFEFENIPHSSLDALEKKVPVHPSSSILELTQNRVREKSFVNDLGIGTAEFRRVTSLEELQKAVKEIGAPSVLKTTELGYDGKGQAKIEKDTDLAETWRLLNTHEAILEAFVNFKMEISVIVGRDQHGTTLCYDAVQNEHKNHILDRTIAPAPISKQQQKEAQEIAMKIATALDLVGLIAVEMFVTSKGKILVNELAPRPHNSGHWTIDACVTSQFDQAIRAAAGLPLGSTLRLCHAVMQNLIGEDVGNWQSYTHNPYAKIHLYGKKEVRAGRKMGHVTTLVRLPSERSHPLLRRLKKRRKA